MRAMKKLCLFWAAAYVVCFTAALNRWLPVVDYFAAVAAACALPWFLARAMRAEKGDAAALVSACACAGLLAMLLTIQLILMGGGWEGTLISVIPPAFAFPWALVRAVRGERRLDSLYACGCLGLMALVMTVTML